LSPKYQANNVKEKLLEHALRQVILSEERGSEELVQLATTPVVSAPPPTIGGNEWAEELKVEQQKKTLLSHPRVVRLANKQAMKDSA
jgi:hypothetical protein